MPGLVDAHGAVNATLQGKRTYHQVASISRSMRAVSVICTIYPKTLKLVNRVLLGMPLGRARRGGREVQVVEERARAPDVPVQGAQARGAPHAAAAAQAAQHAATPHSHRQAPGYPVP